MRPYSLRITPLTRAAGRARLAGVARGLGALALAGALASPALAQTLTWPTQPIKLQLPYGPGGVADIVARLLAQRLSDALGQQVLVENRPSAGQTVASELVAKAAPDGYTLLWFNSGHAVSTSLFRSLPFDPVRDFAPVSTVGFFGLALVVNGDSPIRTVAQFIAAAKAKPASFNIGTTSIGSTQFITAELFRSMSAIDAQIVPFKSTPTIIAAIKSGDVQGMVEILAPVMAHVRSGNLRALGVSFDQRFAGLPDVPTIAETVPGYESTAWNALAAPAQTPRTVIDRLNREVSAVIAQPEFNRRLQDLGVDARASTPEALRDLLASETAKWRTVIERAKIEKQ
jgi:tripartite-type tricarboxylate transporter receptor subunit TctC